jgi:hypothetical protein
MSFVATLDRQLEGMVVGRIKRSNASLHPRLCCGLFRATCDDTGRVEDFCLTQKGHSTGNICLKIGLICRTTRAAFGISVHLRKSETR